MRSMYSILPCRLNIYRDVFWWWLFIEHFTQDMEEDHLITFHKLNNIFRKAILERATPCSVLLGFPVAFHFFFNLKIYDLTLWNNFQRDTPYDCLTNIKRRILLCNLIVDLGVNDHYVGSSTLICIRCGRCQNIDRGCCLATISVCRERALKQLISMQGGLVHKLEILRF